jgi:predicted nuclease with TOPRIM domain
VFLGDRFLGYGASGTPRPDVAQGLPVEYAGFDFKFRRATVVGAMERPRLFVLSSNGLAAELRFSAVQEAMAVRAELADLRAERTDLRVKCSELASQLDTMRAERADLRVKCSGLASQLDAMRAERADLHVKCSELASQLDAMRAERADLHVKCSELASQLNAMENSTSWRITAPLRHIRRFVSRFSAR